MIDPVIWDKVTEQLTGKRKISFLVGAGLSSESGIPTFRGEGGYWTVGSKHYKPQEMGTFKMFRVNSSQVWAWYIHRMQVCRAAKPNAGHWAIAEMQKLFPKRFALISQNVDGLHFATGMDEKQLFLIHGDLRYIRCSGSCSPTLFAIPEKLLERSGSGNLSQEEIALIKCPKCDDICRPHVLWFDEYYDEKYYRLNSVQRIAKETGLLFVVGTSGATTLPQRLVALALSHSSVVIDINPKTNLLTDKITSSNNGFWIKGKSGDLLPALLDRMTSLLK